MNATFVKFLSSFIPVRKIRRHFRNKCYLYESRKRNSIHIQKNNKVRCKIRVDGRDNDVRLKLCGRSGAIVDITVYGNNNEIIVGEDVFIGQQLKIVIGQNHPHFGAVSNCRIVIGRRTSIESCQIITYNYGAQVEIGEGCMFSTEVTLYQTDGHPIVDRNSGKIINVVHSMKIGNHVWVGAGVSILKNSSIADDTIVGMKSVVAGIFTQKHCAIAGNPARVVTSNNREITWMTAHPDYIANKCMLKREEVK